MKSRAIASLAAIGAVLVVGCGETRAAAPPAEDDPAITAAVDSLFERTVAGAGSANADQVMAIAAGAPGFTFLSGDHVVSGRDSVQASFAKTYSSIRSQSHNILSKRIRALGPDLAVLIVTGEGAYMDSLGVVSEPVGMGLTVVFVRRNGTWTAEHAHQSIVH